MKIEEMADVLLNSDNFENHTFLNLAPLSSYALNLQLSYKTLRSSFLKKTPPKSPHLLGLIEIMENVIMS